MDMSEPMNKTIQAKTIAELLPCLGDILSQDSIQTLTAKKQQRPTTIQTRTTVKVTKPLTIAEMKADVLGLTVFQSPKKFSQTTTTSSKKRPWNSSVKVDKKISHTGKGQLKNHPVRKVLNFQSNPKFQPAPSQRFIDTGTPKFPKPESRAKKTLHIKTSEARISGVFNIPETPALSQPRRTVNIQCQKTISNKENISNFANTRKSVLPKPLPPKLLIHHVPDTRYANDSWKSNNDNSFLQREKEINDEEINKTINKPPESKLDVPQTASTPFKEFRNVQECFNNSSCVTSPTPQDNTIMTFDKSPICDSKREESVIVSLCELLSKATVTENRLPSKEQDQLLQLQEQTEKRIKSIDNVIEVLKSMRESEIKSLESVNKLIQENNLKNGNNIEECKETIDSNKVNKKEKTPSPQQGPVVGRLVSVIKSSHKSPTYKIPKKITPLRKKVYHKSMPSVLIQTPPKDKALSMYLKMKEQMNFLNTPVSKKPKVIAPDTPSLTSQNLQMQLDKLFTES